MRWPRGSCGLRTLAYVAGRSRSVLYAPAGARNAPAAGCARRPDGHELEHGQVPTAPAEPVRVAVTPPVAALVVGRALGIGAPGPSLDPALSSIRTTRSRPLASIDGRPPPQGLDAPSWAPPAETAKWPYGRSVSPPLGRTWTRGTRLGISHSATVTHSPCSFEQVSRSCTMPLRGLRALTRHRRYLSPIASTRPSAALEDVAVQVRWGQVAGPTRRCGQGRKEAGERPQVAECDPGGLGRLAGPTRPVHRSNPCANVSWSSRLTGSRAKSNALLARPSSLVNTTVQRSCSPAAAAAAHSRRRATPHAAPVPPTTPDAPDPRLAAGPAGIYCIQGRHHLTGSTAPRRGMRKAKQVLRRCQADGGAAPIR